MTDHWQPELFSSPLFADLDTLLEPAGFETWPQPAELGSLLKEGLASGAGWPLRFIRPRAGAANDALGYELRIYRRGEIQTRPANWHDVFNAFIWALFPASKIALNALHVAAPSPTRRGRRSPHCDALTLLDECGVLLACADQSLQERHAAHDWYGLFVERRADWGRAIAPLVFGHGLYEQCLRPYLGLTAKAYYLKVPPAWFDAPLAARYRAADTALAADLRTRGSAFVSTGLLPLPVLGVPGWHAANEVPEFYADARYFRPK